MSAHATSLDTFATSITDAKWLRAPTAASWRGATIDSRDVKHSQVFFALRGVHVDGHAFIGAALDSGAACAVIEDTQAFTNDLPTGGVLLVPNVERAMAEAARMYRRSALKNAAVLAVTGSNGKTSTCRLLAAACSRPGSPAWLPEKSFNNHLGVPLTLLNAPADSKHIVCEVGTSGPGEIARLGAIIEPDACAIISVGRSHLQGLGSIEGVANEKASLSAAVPEGGLIVASAHAPGLIERLAGNRRVITYGVDRSCDRRVSVLEEAETLVRCSIEGIGELRVPMPGRHSALNAAAAVILAIETGVDPADAIAGIARADPPPMRLAWETINGVRLLVDAYNANPESTLAALGVLASANGDRRVAVLGDMLELGPGAPAMHREVLDAALASHAIDRVVCIGPAYAGCGAAASPKLTLHPDGRGSWPARVAASLATGDAVLLKASRGMALERLIDAVRTQQAAPAAD